MTVISYLELNHQINVLLLALSCYHSLHKSPSQDCRIDYCRFQGEERNRKTRDVLSRNSPRRYSMPYCEVITYKIVEEMYFLLVDDQIEKQDPEWQWKVVDDKTRQRKDCKSLRKPRVEGTTHQHAGLTGQPDHSVAAVWLECFPQTWGYVVCPLYSTPVHKKKWLQTVTGIFLRTS